MYKLFKQYALVFSGALLLFFTSCTSTKQVVYFNDLTDTANLATIANAKSSFENKIQKNDQLSITVGGSNAADLAVLNSGSSSASVSNPTLGSGPNTGFLVEADGNIKIPYVGKMKVEGLTRLELEDTLTKLYKDYTKNPTVNVRFLNYSFSVLGEVSRSGKYTMISERTTILEALTMAGDITVLGRRENVLVIREENGERKFARVNLLTKDIFNSPYFYLRTNDVVYVEPVKSKFIARTGVPQYLTLAAVGLSLILTIVNLRN
jgi:polysaccharide biosynthesis/export protein